MEIASFQNKTIAVIISYHPTNRLLNNIVKLEKECKEILIVDNGSDLASLEFLGELEKKSKVKVHYCGENLGIAAALNIGLKYAYEKNYDWLLTFDQDSEIITENYAFKMFSITSENFDMNEVAVMGGNYPRPLDPLQPNVDRYPPATGKITHREVNTLITSGNLLNLNVIKKSGVLFNEDFFIDYVDFEFCLNLKELGYKNIQVLDACFEHAIGIPDYRVWKKKRVIVSHHNYIRKYYIFRNSRIVHDDFGQYEEWVDWSKQNIKRQIRNIIFFENDKLRKILSMYLGFRDGKKKKMGKWNYKL